MSTSDRIAKEWAEVLPLISQVHDRFPWMTIGEVVHVAAVVAGGESPWGASSGTVTIGLHLMLDLPPDTEFGPRGPQETR